MIRLGFATALTAALVATPLAAQDLSAFKTGPVFEDFGPHAPVPDQDFAIPEETDLYIAFDAAKAAEDGRINRTIESAARFINMHNTAGVEPARVRVAVVVHGKATLDLLNDAKFAERELGEANATAAVIPELLDMGVRIVLCGQSAAANGVAKEDLVPGVEMALSAMTAHAVLQRQGYTVNPF
ncbi:DsrE family protein [Erythrobacter sp. F6033]|uniref:DsrE family protein n=1 Tax=Erythrobacter sp. F6033 TaxID=2926401 RepID=UPI001FF21F00|nr:DsrE family protein [Erythrobacter sp. F6033]MCK0127281.1 DsrE family protein [Erythrobacter sp. F6033]